MNTIKFVADGKAATRYNDAFKVFELSDHGAIERMFTAAKERRA